MREFREVMRTRLRLVVRRTAARVQVHALAEKAGWQLNGREFEDLEALEQQVIALLPEGPGHAAQCWLDHIRLLNQQVQNLEGWLHQRLVPDQRIQRLREVPGIGVIGAYHPDRNRYYEALSKPWPILQLLPAGTGGRPTPAESSVIGAASKATAT